jgi:flagellar basal body-associated protein FliL
MEATTISGIGDMLIKWTEELSLGALMEGRVATAINTFVLLSALVAVALIVVAGYMFITSSGDPEKVGKASKALTAAIVGMVIVFAARWIVGFVVNVLEDDVQPPVKRDAVDVPPAV